MSKDAFLEKWLCFPSVSLGEKGKEGATGFSDLTKRQGRGTVSGITLLQVSEITSHYANGRLRERMSGGGLYMYNLFEKNNFTSEV